MCATTNYCFFVSIIIALLTDLVPPPTGFRRLTCTYIKPAYRSSPKEQHGAPHLQEGLSEHPQSQVVTT